MQKDYIKYVKRGKKAQAKTTTKAHEITTDALWESQSWCKNTNLCQPNYVIFCIFKELEQINNNIRL